MSISPLEFPTLSSADPTSIDPTGSTAGTTGTDFSSLLINGIDSLEGMTDKAANLSVQAATGDLSSIHDYTIAASEAQLATQLTTAVRDKAVTAFQSIMNMQV